MSFAWITYPLPTRSTYQGKSDTRAGVAITGEKYLKFRCSGCGNCCKEPLLPLTHIDLRRIATYTGQSPDKLVRFVDRHAIDMDDDPASFVRLRPGKRVMVLRQDRHGCIFLDDQDRCSIYRARPLGCRIFPFDPTFTRQGKLRRLKLIQATDCKYELDGENDTEQLHDLHTRYEANAELYQDKISGWNRIQQGRLRQGKSAQTARQFLQFLGVYP